MKARDGAPTFVVTPPSHLEGPPTDAWASLAREIHDCRKCPLGFQRTQAVVYRGAERPWLVFVGEAPGAEEDRLGRPFLGRGGRILDAAIARAGIGAPEFGVVNLLKCRPPGNRFDPIAATTCRPYLDRQIDLLRPQALVTLGRRALAALDPSAPPIMVSAGSPREAGGPPIFPLVHPAATLRSRTMAERWNRDGNALAAWVSSFRR